MKKLFLSIFVLLALLTNVFVMQATLYDLEKCINEDQVLNLKVGDQITYSLNSTAPYPEKVIQVNYVANLAHYNNLEKNFSITVKKPQFSAGGSTQITLTLTSPFTKQTTFTLDVQRYKRSNRVLLVSE